MVLEEQPGARRSAANEDTFHEANEVDVSDVRDGGIRVLVLMVRLSLGIASGSS